jgi:hypothetical protein
MHVRKLLLDDVGGPERDQGRALVDSQINFQFPQRTMNFLTTGETISLSRCTSFQGFNY